MRPHEPATNRIFYGHCRIFDKILAIPFAFPFQAGVIIAQILHTPPTVVVERTTQVVLFFIGPDRILEIIGRTGTADTTPICFIQIHFRICLVCCNIHTCARLSIRCFNRTAIPKRDTITHCLNPVGAIDFRISHHIH